MRQRQIFRKNMPRFGGYRHLAGRRLVNAGSDLAGAEDNHVTMSYHPKPVIRIARIKWTGGGAVERAGLENRLALRGNVGSNPTLSVGVEA